MQLNQNKGDHCRHWGSRGRHCVTQSLKSAGVCVAGSLPLLCTRLRFWQKQRGQPLCWARLLRGAALSSSGSLTATPVRPGEPTEETQVRKRPSTSGFSPRPGSGRTQLPRHACWEGSAPFATGARIFGSGIYHACVTSPDGLRERGRHRAVQSAELQGSSSRGD